MMEVRDWAFRILSADCLEDKLFTPQTLTDFHPGSPYLFKEPCRPLHMKLQHRSRKEKIPSFQEHGQEEKRAVCLHRFAGHELLAVEIMAYALLAFPDASKRFRKAVSFTLKEEQEHVRLYMDRMKQMRLNFGELPLYKHFWAHVPYLTNPLEYISVMNLTLEMANLDFAPMYGKSFRHFGDELSAKLMDQILEDEIKHVSIGYHWLCQLKPKSEKSWDTFIKNQSPLLSPKRAKGFQMFKEYRRLANIPDDWIEKIASA